MPSKQRSDLFRAGEVSLKRVKQSVPKFRTSWIISHEVPKDLGFSLSRSMNFRANNIHLNQVNILTMSAVPTKFIVKKWTLLWH